ncbi:MAG TPA: hypothetical protein VKT78_19205, partial [Fimbriimonadaceae bacterium]|nr:hypothetical protein [Fimbriimonadaceae bacterium]
MKRLLKAGAIGPKEGLLFSDIRLHMALVKRSRNAHLFMLDLLEEAVPLDEARLDDLATAQSLYKIRYVCDPPVKDDRHLRLLPHVALVCAQLTKAGMIYDLYQRRVFSVDELAGLLAKKQDAARADVHVKVRWTGLPDPRGQTRGLVKKGIAELNTEPMETDEENLVTYVLGEAAKAAWEAGEIPPSVDVEYFGAQFEVRPIEKVRSTLDANVRILRKEPI